ncbi:MAG: undecaprenyldiphospho-muramoylpentapeptide beta-N-acetylglucosaminyltransferase [Balneolaceae bacterium]|nr:MAG: undecaprenyldiphospho-muramoylpentapeptide beta-N-acetylglucosaminyltransferase [Balneolaceae bacterium]
MSPPRIIMAAGGTGGHVYPAIAIADAYVKKYPEAKVMFVGTRDRMEWQTVPKYGYEIKSVWISGFHRRLTIQNLIFPLKLIVSVIQSLFILRSFKPDMVIACGGFASGPIGWVAVKLGIPLILQEQNSFPGVTNRMLAKHAEKIFTAFNDADKFLPKEKVHLTGNPVRNVLKKTNRDAALAGFGFTPDKKVLLVMGGSGGALALNEAMLNHIDSLHNNLGLQIIWQCGDKYLKGIITRLNLSDYPNLRLTAFIDDMSAAYGSADLVITRAGAGTCSELMAIGQPAVLVPSPNVAGNHQEKNARSLVDSGAALLLKEENLETDLIQTIEGVISDKKNLDVMSAAMQSLAKPNAAAEIVQEISTHLIQKN